jgi:hypothetical protein
MMASHLSVKVYAKLGFAVSIVLVIVEYWNGQGFYNIIEGSGSKVIPSLSTIYLFYMSEVD